MKIAKYTFGKITINAVEHRSDLIITPDEKLMSWWRKSTHQVILDDLRTVFEQHPAIMVIGTGYYGLMQVEKEVKDYCRNNKIKLIVNKTGKAIENYNSITIPNVAAALHLSC